MLLAVRLEEYILCTRKLTRLEIFNWQPEYKFLGTCATAIRSHPQYHSRFQKRSYYSTNSSES